MNLDQITSPTLILDKEKCKKNIEFMVEKSKKHNLIFRPHFKTHQSRIIGSWFKQQGVNKITVSSLKMAEYFANDDWNDITVAFPVNIREIDTINSIAEEVQLNIIVENPQSVEFLKEHLNFPVGFFIKIDTGYHRTGVSFDIVLSVDRILESASDSDKLEFKGFLSHAGNTYDTSNTNEITDIHKDARDKLVLFKNQYIDKYPNIIISTGDTPSCSIVNNFEGIDEIRPGNFVFYDLTQYILNTCKIEDIAVAMICPIVAKHSDRNEIILYGGGVHFSKEFLEIENQKTYGQLVEISKNGWNIIHENLYLTKLSQEHGTVKVSNEIFTKLKIGDLLGIIPIHSCMTANLMKEYITTDDDLIDHL
jgi:D-serine deaminase-like pyridoxal phosphate-dependent protein